MSLFVRSVINNLRQPCRINNLTTAFRSLSVTPCVMQEKPKLTPKEQSPKSLTISSIEQKHCKYVFDKVNEQLKAKEEGRLFAIVHLCGKQFKITAGDIILVEGYWPPTIGDEIRLEKVLLAGARDFTLIGRPILASGLVNIKATIIEKTLTHTKTHFKKKRRKQYTRINFQRSPNTMIRINTIEITRPVDKATEINDKRIF